MIGLRRRESDRRKRGRYSLAIEDTASSQFAAPRRLSRVIDADRSLSIGRLEMKSRATVVQALGGQFSGTVRDGDSGPPINGAEVVISGLDSVRTAAADGQFVFAQLPPGHYAVLVRRFGFIPIADSVAVLPRGRARRMYQLSAAPLALDTVRSAADSVRYISPALRAFEARRRSGDGGYFIGEAQLRSLDNENLANAMRSRVPGINWIQYGMMTFAASQRGNSGIGAHPRALPYDAASPRGCWVSVFIDGVRIYDPGGGGAAPDFGLLAVNQFAGAEFYAGAASVPLQFRSMSHGDCGVLLLWTRER